MEETIYATHCICGSCLASITSDLCPSCKQAVRDQLKNVDGFEDWGLSKDDWEAELEREAEENSHDSLP